MGKPLQIRDVPDETHAALRAKARRAGMSLAAYALQVLERDATRPSLDEVLDRIETRSGGLVAPGAAAAALDEGRAEGA